MKSYDPTMQPGQRIGNFEIGRLLGWGGMGEVYEAQDVRLERTVALKVIRPQLNDPKGHKRFLREAQSVARLNHPAIVRIHHIGHEQNLDYIVMEFVEGTSLAERLRKVGTLAPRFAASLFREVAEGLAEAHRHDIVHRDLKAPNLMVTPEGRAKILDFGIAKRLSAVEVLSETGTILGTFHTMSPEQVDGGDIDHRSDLFSFGAVFYQALTGTAPFLAENARETLARVLTHHPPPVADLDRRIPEPLSDLLVDLLQKKRGMRPPNASAVVVVLNRILEQMPDPEATATKESTRPLTHSTAQATGHATKEVTPREKPGTEPPRKRYLFAALSAVLLTMAAAWLDFKPQGPGPAPAMAVAPERPAVAILGLDNLDARPEDDWLASAIGEILVHELRAGDEIRVVDNERVAQARRERSLDSLSALTDADFRKTGRHLQVDEMVWGRYQRIGGKTAHVLDIELHLRNPASGRDLARNVSGAPQQLVRPIRRIVAEFRQELGATALTVEQELAVEAALPEDHDALRWYAQGLVRLWGDDFRQASEDLQAAVTAAPEHPMPYVALAQTLTALGEDDAAMEATAQARGLARELAETTRRRVEARAYAATGQWELAAASYESLFLLYPGDLELGVRLAGARLGAEDTRGTHETVQRLRRLREPLSLDPRIDLLEAQAFLSQGEAAGALALARQAAAKAEEIGARRLTADAHIAETSALQDLGQHELAQTALEKASRLYGAMEDRYGIADTLDLMAVMREKLGDGPGARALLEEARQIYLTVGDQRRAAETIIRLVTLLTGEGRLSEAIETLEDALRSARRVGAQREEATILSNLGTNLLLLGDLQQAIGRYAEAIALYDELGDQSGAAISRTNVGEILYIQGDLQSSRKRHEEALAINHQIFDRAGIAYDNYRLGKILVAQGDLFAAGKQLDEALAMQTEFREPGDAAVTQTELAGLELLAGNPGKAETLAREAEETLRNSKLSDMALEARTVLVRALLAQNNSLEAQKILTEGREAAEKSQNQRVRLLTAIVTAQVKAKNPAEARAAVTDLEQVAAEAKAANYVEEHFEARLAAGATEAALGEEEAASQRLTKLAEDAEKQGFKQIARRATAVLRR